MNRYTLAGVIKDARAGRQVIVVGRNSYHFVRDVGAGKGAEHVEQTSGRQRVTFKSGGTVRFVNHRNEYDLTGGLPTDVVVLDRGASADHELTDRLRSGRRTFEVIRAD